MYHILRLAQIKMYFVEILALKTVIYSNSYACYAFMKP